MPKPDDDTFKLAVKACLDEDPVEGNCHKFAKQSEFGIMSMWDVSEVTDMSEAFVDQERFNGDLSQWDTRSVKYFDRMFSGNVVLRTRRHFRMEIRFEKDGQPHVRRRDCFQSFVGVWLQTVRFDRFPLVHLLESDG